MIQLQGADPLSIINTKCIAINCTLEALNFEQIETQLTQSTFSDSFTQLAKQEKIYLGEGDIVFQTP